MSASDGQFAAGQIGLATFNASADFDNVLVENALIVDPTTRPPTTTASPPPPPPPGGLIGFASVNALGQNGTTGGAGGPTVTVTTADQLEDYAGRAGPYIIMVSARSVRHMITVVANNSSSRGATAPSPRGLQLGSTTLPGNHFIIRHIPSREPSATLSA